MHLSNGNLAQMEFSNGLDEFGELQVSISGVSTLSVTATYKARTCGCVAKFKGLVEANDSGEVFEKLTLAMMDVTTWKKGVEEEFEKGCPCKKKQSENDCVDEPDYQDEECYERA